MTSTNENLTPKVMREIARELKALDEAPPVGIRVILNEENLANINVEVDGPVGTPYEGGLFRMKLVLGQDFPQTPPKGYFLTKIFHPNIARNGEICVNTLKKDWKPTLGLKHVLLVVRCLLIEPYPESALNEEAGKLLLEDYDRYVKHARLMTSIHASKGRPLNKVTVADSGAVMGGEGVLVPAQTVPAGAMAVAHGPLGAVLAQVAAPAGVELPVLGADITSGMGSSPSAKKPKGEGDTRAALEKKKVVDGRKKSLKRL